MGGSTSKGVECPECGCKTPKLVNETSTRTAPDVHLDKNGKKHVHDGKTYTKEYECSKNHKFSKDSQGAPCGVCGFPAEGYQAKDPEPHSEPADS